LNAKTHASTTRYQVHAAGYVKGVITSSEVQEQGENSALKFILHSSDHSVGTEHV
jgi:hypothetical protein